MELGVGSPALGHDLDLIFWVVGDVVELPVEVVLVLVLPSVWTREDLPVLGQDFALSLETLVNSILRFQIQTWK